MHDAQLPALVKLLMKVAHYLFGCVCALGCVLAVDGGRDNHAIVFDYDVGEGDKVRLALVLQLRQPSRDAISIRLTCFSVPPLMTASTSTVLRCVMVATWIYLASSSPLLIKLSFLCDG